MNASQPVDEDPAERNETESKDFKHVSATPESFSVQSNPIQSNQIKSNKMNKEKVSNDRLNKQPKHCSNEVKHFNLRTKATK